MSLHVRMTLPGLSRGSLRINKVCKLKKTTNNFQTSSRSGHDRMNDYCCFFGYAVRPNLVFVCPFLMIQILNPCPAEFWLVIYYYCIRLKIKPVLPYRQNLKKVQTYPPPKLSQHIQPGKWNAAGPQQHTKDKRLQGMLLYKVGHPCRLRFSWLHE